MKSVISPLRWKLHNLSKDEASCKILYRQRNVYWFQWTILPDCWQSTSPHLTHPFGWITVLGFEHKVNGYGPHCMLISINPEASFWITSPDFSTALTFSHHRWKMLTPLWILSAEEGVKGSHSLPFWVCSHFISSQAPDTSAFPI